MKRVLFFSVAAFFFSLAEVDAQVFVKADATGTNDGSSWTNAFTNFQSGVNFAVTRPGEDVWVAKGTYQPAFRESFHMQEGVRIYGGFSGTETALNQRNWKTNVTILYGNDNSVIRNDQNGLTNAAILDGFTITGGVAQSSTINSNGFEATGSFGGGMYNDQASPFLRNLIFDNNKAIGLSGADAPTGTAAHPDGGDAGIGQHAYGGGIFSTSPLNLVNVTFTNNVAQGGNGGNGGNGYNGSNGSDGGNGGWAGSGGGGLGGAVFLSSAVGVSSTFVNVVMQNNIAQGGNSGLPGNGGSGVNGGDGGNPGIPGATEPTELGVGGGLSIFGSDSVTLVNTLIADNQAIGGNGAAGGKGGAGTAKDGADSPAGSGGSGFGGGIFSLAPVSYLNTTISNNSAIEGKGGPGSTPAQNAPDGQALGGGIYDGGNAHLTNSIVLGNTPTETVLGANPPSSEDQAYRSPNNIVGEVDPTTIFTDFNGGVYTLKPNSVVVNAGTNSYYDGSTYGNVDVAGNPRIVDTTIDLGAYEYQANLAVSDVSQQSLQVYPNPTTGVVFVQTTERAKLEVYNLNGQLMKTQNLETGKNTINLTNLAAGIYLLKAGNKTFKVVKE